VLEPELHQTPLLRAPQGGVAEETLVSVVQWIRLLVEAAGATVIMVGVLSAGAVLARGVVGGKVSEAFSPTRLVLARYLALALELQLGADVLSTAIAPTWDQIGKLGAIAVIRTALNYFLRREMHEGSASEKR
jgi:uncharacterized membrane protein